MPLLGGSTMLGKQLSALAPMLASPRKITQTAPLLPMDAGQSSFDPLGSALTPSKITTFGDAGSSTFDPMSGRMSKFNPADLFAAPLPASVPTGQLPGQAPMGGIGTFQGNLGVLNQYDAAFQQAAARHGGGAFDANWIKALAAMEGGWGAGATSGAGAQGIMQIMPGGYPELEALYPNWRNDPSQNIMLGAAILSAKIGENGGSRDMGTQRYLGVGVDPWTGVSTEQYLANITNFWNDLNQSRGSFGQPSGGGGGGFSTAFGSGSVPDWGEFNQESGLGYYTYGNQYGLSGTTHTGLDVVMEWGAPFQAAFAGRVTCAGTGNGPGADGGGCAAFGYDPGSFGGGPARAGAGRVEITSLDGNIVLIYGHALGSAAQVGQNVNAGDLIGWNGGMNSAHVHLEARVRDNSTPSGWRIVDPRTVMGGGGIGALAGGNPYAQTGYQQPQSFAQNIRSFQQSRL